MYVSFCFLCTFGFADYNLTECGQETCQTCGHTCETCTTCATCGPTCGLCPTGTCGCTDVTYGDNQKDYETEYDPNLNFCEQFACR